MLTRSVRTAHSLDRGRQVCRSSFLSTFGLERACQRSLSVRVCKRLTLLVGRTLFGILILHHQSPNNLVETKSGRMPPVALLHVHWFRS